MTNGTRAHSACRSSLKRHQAPEIVERPKEQQRATTAKKHILTYHRLAAAAAPDRTEFPYANPGETDLTRNDLLDVFLWISDSPWIRGLDGGSDENLVDVRGFGQGEFCGKNKQTNSVGGRRQDQNNIATVLELIHQIVQCMRAHKHFTSFGRWRWCC